MPAPDPIAIPTADLPVAVAHGGLVLALLLLLAALMGAALAVWRARRRALGRHRTDLTALREQLISSAAFRNGARAALRGRLVGPPALGAVDSLWFERRGEPAEREGTAAERDGLALELEGKAGRVALDGPIRVLVGRAVTGGRGRDAAAVAAMSDEATALARRAPWTRKTAATGETDGVVSTELHRLPVGVEVLASGELVLGPAREQGAGYRDAAEAWSLRGSEHAPVELASEAGSRPPWRASRWRRGLILGLLLGYGALFAAGRVCLALAGDDPMEPDAPVELDAFHPLVVAAAMPHSRDRALGALASRLEEHPRRDATSVARLAALARLRLGCDHEAAVWEEHRQPEIAAARALDCESPAVAARALAQLGDYERAAEQAAVLVARGDVPDRRALVPLLAGGRVAEAARAARLLHRAQLALIAERTDPGGLVAQSARICECLALHLEHRQGDPRALPALAGVARGPGGLVCGPLHADLLSGDERARFLAAWREMPASTQEGPRNAEHAMALGMHYLAFLDGPVDDMHEGASFEGFDVINAVAMKGTLGDLDVRLAPVLTAAIAARPRRTDVEEETLAYLRLVGVALRTIEEPSRGMAELAALEPRPGQAERTLALKAAVELRSGMLAPSPPQDWFQELVALRRGEEPEAGEELADALQVHQVSVADQRQRLVERAVERAVTGDGGPLAALLQSRRSSLDERALLGLAPRMREGREELAELFTWRTDGGPISGDPCSHWSDAAMRRDVLAWLGDASGSARWAAIARRHGAVCTDSDTAVALWMLSQL